MTKITELTKADFTPFDLRNRKSDSFQKKFTGTG